MEYSNLRFGTFYIVYSKPVSKHLFNFVQRATLHASSQMSLLKEVEWDTAVSRDVSTSMLVARLINVGNAQQVAVVRLNIPDDVELLFSRDGIRALSSFVNQVFDVTSMHRGDVIIDDIDVLVSKDSALAGNVESTIKIASEPCPYDEVKRSKRTSWIGKLKCRNVSLGASVDLDNDEELSAPYEVLIDEDADELALIQKEQRDAFKRLRSEVIKYVLTYHADPAQLMQHLLEGKFVVNANGLSPLVVNGDTEIVLTGYDEVNVKMPAMCRAIYILFLCHHDTGIVLKEISDYQDELEDIYSVVKPGRDVERRRAIIEAVCDPLSNRLNECLSRIKKCFTIVMGNTPLVDNYCITGNPGQPYRINLPSEMVTIPSVFTKK